jgi:hypothetical protein
MVELFPLFLEGIVVSKVNAVLHGGVVAGDR